MEQIFQVGTSRVNQTEAFEGFQDLWNAIIVHKFDDNPDQDLLWYPIECLV